MKKLLSLALASAISQAAFADTVAINNVVLSKDSKEVVNVLVEDGNIDVISKSAFTGADRIIDGEGAILTAGLISPIGTIGLVEVSAVDSANHAGTPESMGAAMSQALNINTDSTHIPLQRKYGVTSTVVSGYGNLFSGQPLYLALDENVTTRNTNLGQSASLSSYTIESLGGSRGAALLTLKKALTDASELLDNEDFYDRESTYSLGKAQLEALADVVKGDKPLAIQAHSSQTISHLLDIAKELDIKLIIVGGGEAWRVADKLAAAEVPVMVNAFANVPADFDQIGSRLDNAALLDKAGVSVMFFTGEMYTGKRLSQIAGNAVANGMDYDAAMAALTVNPAKAWNLGKVGEVKPGYTADLVLWNGDPLELSSQPTMVMINGEIQDTSTRSDKLAQRYLEVADRDRAYKHK